uniref:Pectate lyase superfamily protein domain-containing protein n=1 Tax=Manihot esculenta TaxID=3983 RepID=A0A2C9W3N9_MANES
MQKVQLLTIIFIFISSIVSNLAIGDATSTFNVVDFGAIGDGETDNSKAFLQAWKALCEAEEDEYGGMPMLQIPDGTFLLKPLQFQGPCVSNSIHIQLLGKILAPSTIKRKWWILFTEVNGLILDGSGSIDGQGSLWWNKALQFHRCDNLELSGLTHINSPKGHMGLNYCNGVSISNLTITAPQDSPNTDGIDISYSSQVNIFNSTIATGDDCIAINGGCSYININNVKCGPGHGISVGSLGDKGEMDLVEEVHVQNCTFIGTENGARIKTWPGGSGYARKISFEQIILQGTKNPIIIDQYYCNGHQCSLQELSERAAVKVSEIKYSGISGTSESQQGITLNCAELGCTNITMEEINITSSEPGEEIYAYCQNANGTSSFTFPQVPCLLGF